LYSHYINAIRMATTRSFGGAAHRKSVKFWAGQGAKNDTFLNLSQQPKEQRQPNFQNLPHLQQEALW